MNWLVNKSGYDQADQPDYQILLQRLNVLPEELEAIAIN
jgi:hypothetical protein